MIVPRISLRARLALVFAAGMTVVSILVAGFVYVQLRNDLRHAVNQGLAARARTFDARAGATNGRSGLVDDDEAFAQVLTADGRIASATRAVREAPLLRASQLASITEAKYFDVRPQDLESSRLLALRVQDAGGIRFLVVGATLSDTQEALERLLEVFAVALPAALIVSSLIGWWLAGLALRPVSRMIDEAGRVSASDPSRRLPVPTTDPSLQRLAVSLNESFDRLQEAVERERAFADNASHELRTPLTVLKAEVDVALAGDRSHQELHDSLAAASAEIDHLVRIAEGLLVLARANGGTIPTERAAARLDELVDDCVRGRRERAAERGIRLEVTAASATVSIDRTRFRQALQNVLDNALRHVPSGGSVCVSAEATGSYVSVTVDDSGPGFADQTLAHAFEPFNRAPGDEDGTGLGMAIASAIAEAHGGTATAANLPGGGARVVLTFA